MPVDIHHSTGLVTKVTRKLSGFCSRLNVMLPISICMETILFIKQQLQVNLKFLRHSCKKVLMLMSKMPGYIPQWKWQLILKLKAYWQKQWRPNNVRIANQNTILSDLDIITSGASTQAQVFLDTEAVNHFLSESPHAPDVTDKDVIFTTRVNDQVATVMLCQPKNTTLAHLTVVSRGAMVINEIKMKIIKWERFYGIAARLFKPQGWTQCWLSRKAGRFKPQGWL